MTQEMYLSQENFLIEDGAEVAPSAVLKLLRNSSYGSISDLPDDELALPDELERMVYQQEFGLILELPVSESKCSVKPAIDENGKPDWGAFATVDFDRHKNFDKARYKADKLKEQLKDLLILIYIVNERIHSKAKYKVLKLVRQNVIDVEDIEDWDTWQLAKMYIKALGLRNQIRELCEASKRRREQQFQKWLDFLG